MKLEEGIPKLGFRKWYERELMQSHAHMVLAFLCLIAVFAAFELIADGHNRLGNAMVIVLCTVIGAWAIRRYITLLSSAEAVANQADCPGCGTYARFTLVHARAPDDGVLVHCKHCTREWVITRF
jgi:formate dehydrogenase maturation protein FdhE